MAAPTDRERYNVFLRSGPLKRVYVDIPETAHTMLSELAHKNGLPMKAQLTLLIANEVAKNKPKPKRAITRKKAGRKVSQRKVRSKKRGKKKANKKG